jgi:hypothetical protein
MGEGGRLSSELRLGKPGRVKRPHQKRLTSLFIAIFQQSANYRSTSDLLGFFHSIVATAALSQETANSAFPDRKVTRGSRRKTGGPGTKNA